MVNAATLSKLIEERKDELFDLLCKLIRINSENFGDYGNEKECAEYIASLCQKLGMETSLYSPLDLEGFTEHPDYLDGRHLENRPNVTACWRGASNENKLMLMGHSDTVPIGDPANWSFEPLIGEVREGKVWGRGACDDKYALATVLFLIGLLKELGFEPKDNLLFTAYCDEEKGGSNGALAAALRYPTQHIVNMDGKEMDIYQCASGGQSVKYYFHTKETVDSAALTAQAFPIIMDVISEFAACRRKELEENPFYRGTIIPATSLRYMGFLAGNEGSDLGRGHVRFTFYTDKTKDEIYAQYRQMEEILSKKLAPLGIIGDGFKPVTRFFHYVYADPRCRTIRELQAAGTEAAGRELRPVGSCLSDLSVILKYGSDEAIGFGAGREFGVYGGAHQPDEFIECDKLVEYAKIIGAYILRTVG